MLRNRKDYPRVRTPKGTAIWPSLNEPDYKFKKQDGEFHARLAFDNPDDPELISIIEQAEAIRDEAYDAKVEELTRKKKLALVKKLAKADVVKVEEDPETGEPTGRVILRASLQHRVQIKNGPKAGQEFYKKPDLFDARGKRLKNPPRIGGGSEMKLNATIMDWEKPRDEGGFLIGAKFELNAAQIIKLMSGGERAADDYGFAEEDGDEIEDREETGGFEDEGEGFSGGEDGDDTDF